MEDIWGAVGQGAWAGHGSVGVVGGNVGVGAWAVGERICGDEGQVEEEAGTGGRSGRGEGKVTE